MSMRYKQWVIWPLMAGATCLWNGCSKEAAEARHKEAADTFLEKKEFERAELEYLNLLQVRPDSTYAMTRMGQIYLEQGRLGRAHPYLVRAKDLAPDNLENRLRLATVMLAVGNRTEAFKEADYVFSQNPSNPEAPLLMAEACVSAEAIRLFRERLSALSSDLKATAPVVAARAMLIVKEGKAQEAEALFREALRVDPSFSPAYAGLASLEVTQGRFAEAERNLKRAAELAGPRSPRSVQYAVFKLRLGDLAEAETILHGVVAAAPDYIPALVRLAEVQVERKDYAEAGERLKTVLRQDPTHPEALIVSSRLAVEQGDFARALSQVQILLRMYPQSAEAHVEAARVHLKRNDEEEAFSSLNMAVLYNPDYRNAVVMLAEMNLRRGNVAEAVGALRAFLVKQPTAVDALSMLAEGYRLQGEWTLATETLQRIESLAPGLEDTALRKAVLLAEQQKFDEAKAVLQAVLDRSPLFVPALEKLVEIEDATGAASTVAEERASRALTLDENNARLHVLLGKIFLRSGRNQGAREHLDRALTLEPNNHVAHVLLVKLLLDAKDYTGALKHLQEVVRLSPRDSGAWFLLAGLYQREKNYTAARDAYEKVLELNPNYVPALNSLAYLYADFLNERERAYQLARQARELAPADGKVADTFGRILQQRGDYRSAIAPLKEAATRIPDSAEIRYHLAINAYMLGDEAAATELLSEALRLSTEFPGVDDARAKLRVLKLSTSKENLAATDAVLKDYLAKEPKDPVALRKQGLSLEMAGKVKQAVEVLQRAQELNPQNASLQFTLARAIHASGRVDEALRVGWAARRSAPDDIEGAWILADLTWATRDFTSAFNLYSEVARKRERDPRVWFSLSEAAIAVGGLDEAERALTRALELSPNAAAQERIPFIRASRDPSLAPALSGAAREKLEAGEKDVLSAYVLALVAKDFKEAETRLNQCLLWAPEFSPAKRQFALRASELGSKYDQRIIDLGTQARDMYRNDPAMEKAIAAAVYRQGDYARAVTLLEGVRTALQGDPEYHFYLGMAYRALGRQAQAADTLNQALGLGLTGVSALEARTALATLKPASK